MKDISIQATLEKKISRERILVELEKTLKGPAPARALQIVLDQQLYNTIFTMPDYEENIVPRVSTERLEAMLLRSDEADQKSTRAQSILDLLSLTSVEDRWRGWLICAILPWIGQEMPKAVVKKGAPTTMAARVARDSLKIDNNSMKVVSVAEANVEEARVMVGQHSVQEGSDENSDSSRKRQRTTFDRVQTGLAIRKWGEAWRCVPAAAAMLDMSQARADTRAIMESYSSWLDFVRQEKLENVWNSKIFTMLLDGTAIFNLIKSKKPDVTKGRWMSDAVDIVVEYQLRESEASSKEGAEQVLLSAVEDGTLDVSSVASKKK